jgi:hypothetical protein
MKKKCGLNYRYVDGKGCVKTIKNVTPEKLNKAYHEEYMRRGIMTPKDASPKLKREIAAYNRRSLSAEDFDKRSYKYRHSKEGITHEGQLNLSEKEFKKRGFR